MQTESYRDLKVWQKGMDLAVASYQLTRNFPREEQFSLTSQIRRAAASIPANIAEGYGRGHRPEYTQFLHIAQGSLKELETLLLLSGRVEVSSKDHLTPALELCDEVGRMLRTMIRGLNSR
ncbi:MAG: four helix bundle protein [Armatimonadota bacterium]